MVNKFASLEKILAFMPDLCPKIDDVTNCVVKVMEEEKTCHLNNGPKSSKYLLCNSQMGSCDIHNCCSGLVLLCLRFTDVYL